MIIEPSASITRAFSQVHIVRLTVVRLINHYGYNLVNYDSDTILLMNPQVYFEKHKHTDLIGTFGKGPMGLFKEWGVTLNTLEHKIYGVCRNKMSQVRVGGACSSVRTG